MPERRKIKPSSPAVTPKVKSGKDSGKAIKGAGKSAPSAAKGKKGDKPEEKSASAKKAKVAAALTAKPEKKNGAKAPIFDIRNEKLPEAVDEGALASAGYPYHEKMKRKKYEKRLVALQIELLKMLAWAKEKGERIIVVFEGRDGAGKGGTISRFTQHMPSRQARIVALSKPSDTEKGQWYFQRYASQMPTRGEIVFFDRSWYNRAGVEAVMGFAKPDETEEFLREVPFFEGMLARDGVIIVKLFFSIGREMQMKRLHARFHDPLKHWKLSPIDFEAISRYDAYSEAFNTMLGRTHIERAPWTIIRSNDKLRARIAAMQAVLVAVPYEGKDASLIDDMDAKIAIDAPDWIEAGGER
jgi:polyphosphate kinase 2